MTHASVADSSADHNRFYGLIALVAFACLLMITATLYASVPHHVDGVQTPQSVGLTREAVGKRGWTEGTAPLGLNAIRAWQNASNDERLKIADDLHLKTIFTINDKVVGATLVQDFMGYRLRLVIVRQ